MALLTSVASTSCVITMLVTCFCLGTSYSLRIIDNSNVIAFFNGDCDHRPICSEVCVPWVHGYICDCYKDRIISPNGYSCMDDPTKTTSSDEKTPHTTTSSLHFTSKYSHSGISTGYHKPPSSKTEGSLFNTRAYFNALSYKSTNSKVLQATNNVNDADVKIRSFDLRKGIPDPVDLSHSYTEVDRPRNENLPATVKLEANTPTNIQPSDISADVYNVKELTANSDVSLSCDQIQCLNGGTCLMDSTPNCYCPLGYIGPLCETDVEVRFPRFHGNGYLAFPVLRKAYRSFDIQLEVRPDSMDGLLLFTSELPDASTDYFSVSLVKGRVQFRFDCGTGPATILSEGPVTLGSWNTVAVSRREGAGSLKLNDEPTQYGHSQGDFTRITLREKLYLGGHPNISAISSRVGTNRSMTGCVQHLWVGGYKYDMRQAGDALHGINVDECSTDVCQTVVCQNGGVCRAKSADSHVCLCVLGTDGRNCENSGVIHVPAFTGHSYLQYDGLGHTSLLFTEIEIIFKPINPEGLIMYNGYKVDREGDFFSIAMRAGHVEFRFDLGNGHAVVRSNDAVTLNEWHDVRVMRTARQAYLYVDSQNPVEGIAPGAFTQLTLLLDLFVGGHKDFDQMSRHANMSQSFFGCIQKVVINKHTMGLITDARDGVNVGNCNHACVSVPCTNGGVCIPRHSQYVCSCPLGYTAFNCDAKILTPIKIPSFSSTSYLEYTNEDILNRVRGDRLDVRMFIKPREPPSGLLLWLGQQTMTSSQDYLALGFIDGRLELRFDLGNGEAVISIELKPSSLYNSTLGPGWHSVAIQRSRETGSLQVDEGDIVEASAPGNYVMLDTTTPLYIGRVVLSTVEVIITDLHIYGGMPDVARNTLAKYTTGFSGCIQDVILATDYPLDMVSMAHRGQNIDQCQ